MESHDEGLSFSVLLFADYSLFTKLITIVLGTSQYFIGYFECALAVDNGKGAWERDLEEALPLRFTIPYLHPPGDRGVNQEARMLLNQILVECQV